MKKPYIVIRSRVLGQLEQMVNDRMAEGYRLKDCLMMEQFGGETYYLQTVILQENPVVAKASRGVGRSTDE